MAYITQIKVNNIVYDIVDARIPQWALSKHMTMLHDTTAGWDIRGREVSTAGEVYVYDDYSEIGGKLIPAIKIGDGKAYIVDLPFIHADLESRLNKHINDDERHLVIGERDDWNKKVSCDIDEKREELIFE